MMSTEPATLGDGSPCMMLGINPASESSSSIKFYLTDINHDPYYNFGPLGRDSRRAGGSRTGSGRTI